MRWLLGCIVGLCATAPAAAVTCADTVHDGRPYTICDVDPQTDDLRLFHSTPGGTLLGSFRAVENALSYGQLAFAMNAGMYHSNRAPVGHYVEEGRETMRVVTASGPGNFGLLPNGILCIGNGTARVFETLAFVAQSPDCRFATQSGPMLVIDGDLHPRFLPDSTSRYIRNGVGTTSDGGRAVFAISNQPVTFHEFGRFFRDHLNLPDALYFDGNVSRLHAPQLGRSDLGMRLGPIVGVVETRG